MRTLGTMACRAGAILMSAAGGGILGALLGAATLRPEDFIGLSGVISALSIFAGVGALVTGALSTMAAAMPNTRTA